MSSPTAPRGTRTPTTGWTGGGSGGLPRRARRDLERPERELGCARGPGLDAVELGCGTGYVSSWLSRRGARPVGLTTPRGSRRRRGCSRTEFGSRFQLVHADAERTPLRDGSFDLAISEYGAAIWCGPEPFPTRGGAGGV